MAESGRAPWTDNRLALTGTVVDEPQTRTSPAGVPVSRFTLEHASEQPDDGEARQTRFRVSVHARGKALQAEVAALQAGSRVRVLGHLGHTGYRPEQQRLVVIARRIQPQPNQETQGVE